MKKFLIFLILLFTVLSYANENEEKLKLNKIAHNIKIDFSKKMEKKYGFKVVATGLGGVKELNLLSLHFEYPNMMCELSEARHLILECAYEFLKEINSNNYFQKHSKIYPFNDRNIEILIGLRKNNDYPMPFNVALICFSEGKIFYDTYDHEKKYHQKLLSETYEEALKIVEQKYFQTKA